jgi:hypothetical protein
VKPSFTPPPPNQRTKHLNMVAPVSYRAPTTTEQRRRDEATIGGKREPQEPHYRTRKASEKEETGATVEKEREMP